MLRQIRNTIEDSLEQIFRTIFFWTNTDRELGRWIVYFHAGIVGAIGVFVLTYRIFRPPFWVIVSMLAFMLLLFLQHVVLRTCLLSRIERRLLGDDGQFINVALRWFGVSGSREAMLGATILCSGFCMAILISEVVGQLLWSF